MSRTSFLTESEVAKIHEATLCLLEKTGIDLDSEEAEDLLLSAGAEKGQEDRIFIPRKMVAEVLEKSKPVVPVYDRNGEKTEETP